MFEYDSRTRTVGITGYAEPINNNDKFSERGVMNAYMEQVVLYSVLPDEERHDVLKYMDTRDENGRKTTFLQEYIPRADKGRFGSYTKLCDFTLLFMILQVELKT